MLFQDPIVYDINIRFGDEFIYSNRSGNLAIDLKVLAAAGEKVRTHGFGLDREDA
ncbi:DUF6953 family protein [Nitrosovibrio sp. Nv4]|uniref:DUF6953 family protein n=1 Tax=Nitrosovibrio sp. Nv4 TaxID=1945880 RepID=UPI004040AA04